ncbi:hypothetical protein Cgig2_004140 [Carnegiea gigantea]|uniref:Uncharacterized protein n=1 Tax=Carnegiea gigantea TaxID=171969 RepID=A0A9Q1QQY2_9CARY|nr:hypothetical protein Cgig2_004140 [Carnegiea gigantea]
MHQARISFSGIQTRSSWSLNEQVATTLLSFLPSCSNLHFCQSAPYASIEEPSLKSQPLNLQSSEPVWTTFWLMDVEGSRPQLKVVSFPLLFYSDLGFCKRCHRDRAISEANGNIEVKEYQTYQSRSTWALQAMNPHEPISISLSKQRSSTTLNWVPLDVKDTSSFNPMKQIETATITIHIKQGDAPCLTWPVTLLQSVCTSSQNVLEPLMGAELHRISIPI